LALHVRQHRGLTLGDKVVHQVPVFAVHVVPAPILERTRVRPSQNMLNTQSRTWLQKY
jgi:hypothetical protein